jgi:hypothetical protein
LYVVPLGHIGGLDSHNQAKSRLLYEKDVPEGQVAAVSQSWFPELKLVSLGQV